IVNRTSPTRRRSALRLLRDHSEDFLFAHDEVLLAVQLDLLARVLAEEDRVAFLDVERRHLAVLLDLALAHRDDFALLGLFLRAVRNDDPADFLFAFLDPLDDNAVVERANSHCRLCCHSDVTPEKLGVEQVDASGCWLKPGYSAA